MPYQTDLLPALKDWGLSEYIREVNGWQWRGSSVFNPGGSVNHHTAGSTRYSIPSLNILINGRSGLPGPLCNVGQSRSSNFHPEAKFDEVYLIAAGRANHAGTGGWRGLVGNSSVFGLEIEHCGYLDREGFSERRAHTAHLIHCAFAEVGGFDADMVCQHKEWTPRKIDFVGANGKAFRHAVALTQLARYAPPPAPEKDEDEMVKDIERLHVIYLKADPNPRNWGPDLLKSFNYHLWRYASGTASLETIRQDFQKTAGL